MSIIEATSSDAAPEGVDEADDHMKLSASRKGSYRAGSQDGGKKHGLHIKEP
jgi:hypothetical protein